MRLSVFSVICGSDVRTPFPSLGDEIAICICPQALARTLAEANNNSNNNEAGAPALSLTAPGTF